MPSCCPLATSRHWIRIKAPSSRSPSRPIEMDIALNRYLYAVVMRHSEREKVAPEETRGDSPNEQSESTSTLTTSCPAPSPTPSPTDSLPSVIITFHPDEERSDKVPPYSSGPPPSYTPGPAASSSSLSPINTAPQVDMATYEFPPAPELQLWNCMREGCVCKLSV